MKNSNRSQLSGKAAIWAALGTIVLAIVGLLSYFQITPNGEIDSGGSSEVMRAQFIDESEYVELTVLDSSTGRVLSNVLVEIIEPREVIGKTRHSGAILLTIELPATLRFTYGNREIVAYVTESSPRKISLP